MGWVYWPVRSSELGPSDQSEVVLTMGKDGEGWRQLLWASLYLKNPFWVFGPS